MTSEFWESPSESKRKATGEGELELEGEGGEGEGGEGGEGEGEGEGEGGGEFRGSERERESEAEKLVRENQKLKKEREDLLARIVELQHCMEQAKAERDDDDDDDDGHDREGNSNVNAPSNNKDGQIGENVTRHADGNSEAELNKLLKSELASHKEFIDNCFAISKGVRNSLPALERERILKDGREFALTHTIYLISRSQTENWKPLHMPKKYFQSVGIVPMFHMSACYKHGPDPLTPGQNRILLRIDAVFPNLDAQTAMARYISHWKQKEALSLFFFKNDFELHTLMRSADDNGNGTTEAFEYRELVEGRKDNTMDWLYLCTSDSLKLAKSTLVLEPHLMPQLAARREYPIHGTNNQKIQKQGLMGRRASSISSSSSTVSSSDDRGTGTGTGTGTGADNTDTNATQSGNKRKRRQQRRSTSIRTRTPSSRSVDAHGEVTCQVAARSSSSTQALPATNGEQMRAKESWVEGAVFFDETLMVKEGEEVTGKPEGEVVDNDNKGRIPTPSTRLIIAWSVPDNFEVQSFKGISSIVNENGEIAEGYADVLRKYYLLTAGHFENC